MLLLTTARIAKVTDTDMFMLITISDAEENAIINAKQYFVFKVSILLDL